MLNLKQSDVKGILEQCYDLIVVPEHQVLQDRVDKVMLGIKRRRQQEEDENEQGSDDEEMKRFLKAIDLDEEEEHEDADDGLQPTDNKKYSILFIGLQTIEKLVGLEWALKMGIM